MPRMDNGPELVCQALQRFYDEKVGSSYILPGCPWDNCYLESFNNRLRKECLNRTHWTTLFEARGGHRRRQTRAQPPTPASGPGATERRPCRLRQAGIPTPRWPARSTESDTQQPDSNSGCTQHRGPANRIWSVAGGLAFGPWKKPRAIAGGFCSRRRALVAWVSSTSLLVTPVLPMRSCLVFLQNHS
jgi:Integrase core domain